MRYELPSAVKANLATREVRLHHYLWHGIRNNWHAFTDEHKDQLRQESPDWEPNIPRFEKVGPGPRDIRVNYEAGESFLYMHRRMIQSVDVQLAAIGQPTLVPWATIPEVDDQYYPVPGRDQASNDPYDPKSDANLRFIKDVAAQTLNPNNLRRIPLAELGAEIESFVHDFMHGRWAEVDPGVMEDFPNPNPLNLDPVIDDKYDAVGSDYLGHPYSSHVNSTFWKVHGWVDQCIERWREANGLEQVTWTDTWEGARPEPAHPPHGHGLVDNLLMLHNHIHHNHGHWDEMVRTFRLINSFEECHIGFDYVAEARLVPRFGSVPQ